MAHTLTFNYDDPSSGYTVCKGSKNGEKIHSPYTLQNGDVLYFTTIKMSNTINGTSYDSEDLRNVTLEFADVDVNIVGGSGPQLAIDYSPFVLKYTESGGSTNKVSIDLTTLTGWDNVTSGEHTIQVVAKATGYLDSEKSTAVSFTKASTGNIYTVSENSLWNPNATDYYKMSVIQGSLTDTAVLFTTNNNANKVKVGTKGYQMLTAIDSAEVLKYSIKDITTLFGIENKTVSGDVIYNPERFNQLYSNFGGRITSNNGTDIGTVNRLQLKCEAFKSAFTTPLAVLVAKYDINTDTIEIANINNMDESEGMIEFAFSNGLGYNTLFNMFISESIEIPNDLTVSSAYLINTDGTSVAELSTEISEDYGDANDLYNELSEVGVIAFDTATLDSIKELTSNNLSDLDVISFSRISLTDDPSEYSIKLQLSSNTKNSIHKIAVLSIFDGTKDEDEKYVFTNSVINTQVEENGDFTLIIEPDIAYQIYSSLTTTITIIQDNSESTGKTWVLNSQIETETEFNANISFKDANGNSYSNIIGARYTETGEPPDGAYGITFDGNYVYNTSGSTTGWHNEAYRTITFLAEPTGDLLTWLTANGTKQGGTTAHTLSWTDQYSYAIAITVNGNEITSPYTLQNGDVIKVPTLTKVSINGVSYSTFDESTLNISGEDITIARTGAEKTTSPVPYITINYTE